MTKARTEKARRAAAGDDLEVLHTDDWKAGLRFGLKALSMRKVKRATTPEDVLLVALRHNLRRDNEDHRHRRPPDPARTAQNEVLRGSPDPNVCAELAQNILAELGITPPRWDTIQIVESAYQPPDGWDRPEFWSGCLTWASGRYEHIISAVVHRDQKRPHMHILALAVRNGRFDGAGMTSGTKNRLEAQRAEFMAYMRAALGLRPDRKPKSLAAVFTSPGAGPRTHAAAAKSDAALLNRATRRRPNLIAQQPHSPAEPTDLIAPTSYCAAPTPATPLPTCAALQTPSEQSDKAPPPTAVTAPACATAAAARPADTRIGRLLAARAPRGRQPGYWETRARLLAQHGQAMRDEAAGAAAAGAP